MSAPTPDEVAVRAALEHYIQGHATGDGAHMRLAFNSAGRLFWSSADTLATRTVDEYIARMPGKPAPDEATGVLVAPGDAEGMAAAAAALLGDDALRATLSANAIVDAAKRFDLELQLDETIAWYREIIADWKGRDHLK